MSLINRRRKFEYYKRDYSNPFFNRRDSVYSVYESPLKKRAIRLALLSLMIASVWFFLFSSVFMIKNITVSGLERTNPFDIQQLAWMQSDDKKLYVFPQKNILIFNKPELLGRLQDSYYFEDVSIKKTFGRNLEIYIKEKNPTAVWMETGAYYFIDQSGKIISQIAENQMSRDSYPLIENRGEVMIIDRKADISEENISVIIKLFQEFKNQSYLKIDRFFIDKDIDTIKCISVQGPQIYFSTKNDYAKQVAKLSAVFKDDLKSEFNNKEYIDLRYGDMIYYK